MESGVSHCYCWLFSQIVMNVRKFPSSFCISANKLKKIPVTRQKVPGNGIFKKKCMGRNILTFNIWCRLNSRNTRLHITNIPALQLPACSCLWIFMLSVCNTFLSLLWLVWSSSHDGPNEIFKGCFLWPPAKQGKTLSNCFHRLWSTSHKLTFVCKMSGVPFNARFATVNTEFWNSTRTHPPHSVINIILVMSYTPTVTTLVPQKKTVPLFFCLFICQIYLVYSFLFFFL